MWFSTIADERWHDNTWLSSILKDFFFPSILPSFASLSFPAPWINDLRNQVQKEEQHRVYLPIELFQEVSVSKAQRNVMWQQSLCHLSRCSFSENIPSRPLGRAVSSPLSLLHNHSSVQESGWVLLLPPTALWKQPNLQHTLTLACPHVNTHTHTRTRSGLTKPTTHLSAAVPMGNLT